MTTKLQDLYYELEQDLKVVENDKDEVGGLNCVLNDHINDLKATYKKIKKAHTSIMEITEEMFLDQPILPDRGVEYKRISTDLPYVAIDKITSTKEQPFYRMVIKTIEITPYTYITNNDILNHTHPTTNYFANSLEELNKLYRLVIGFYKGVE